MEPVGFVGGVLAEGFGEGFFGAVGYFFGDGEDDYFGYVVREETMAGKR